MNERRSLSSRIGRWTARIAVRYRGIVVAAATAAALAITLLAWWSAEQDAREKAQRQFDAQALRAAEELHRRLHYYAQVLRGAQALFAASREVDRSEWHAFARSLALETNVPGMLSLAYARRVPARHRAEHERAARAEGLAGYRIAPEGERDEYLPVLYMEPEGERAQRLLGYDLASDPVRRTALERARDTSQPSASAPVALDLGRGSGTQPGFLMFMPVYRKGAPLDSVAGRRDALEGYVYGALPAADFAGDIASAGLDLRIADARAERASALLFESPGAGTAPQRGAAPLFTRAETIVIAGRAWRMELSSRPAFEAAIDRERPHLTLVVGLFLSAFLAAALWSLLTQHRDARRLAARMTRELRESEERLGLALESSGLALFDWNVDTGLVLLSKEWEAMLGGDAKPTEVPAAALQARVHPDDTARVLAEVRALLRNQTQGYKVEHRVRTHGGEWKWIESVARVTARDAQGRARRVTGTNADIAARKAVERMKDQFMDTVSHELRTPLTAIVGSLALVREGETGELPEQAREFVGMAYENAERLATLVNDIRDLQRLEAGRLDFSIGAVEVAPFLGRALALNAAYADRYKVRLALEPMPPDLRVAADDDRLMQVVTNLLSNAAKFSPPGAEVRVAARVAGSQVRISVADRGRGIPPEFRARVFTRFAQAEASDSRQRGGTGLGLAIVKSLVERMAGRVEFESELGVGTTFTVSLPRA